jgi:hypothetical protein
MAAPSFLLEVDEDICFKPCQSTVPFQKPVATTAENAIHTILPPGLKSRSGSGNAELKASRALQPLDHNAAISLGAASNDADDDAGFFETIPGPLEGLSTPRSSKKNCADPPVLERSTGKENSLPPGPSSSTVSSVISGMLAWVNRSASKLPPAEARVPDETTTGGKYLFSPPREDSRCVNRQLVVASPAATKVNATH